MARCLGRLAFMPARSSGGLLRIRTSITATRVARATRVMVVMVTSDTPADLTTNQVAAERVTSSAGPAGPPHPVAEAATNKRHAGQSCIRSPSRPPSGFVPPSVRDQPRPWAVGRMLKLGGPHLDDLPLGACRRHR